MNSRFREFLRSLTGLSKIESAKEKKERERAEKKTKARDWNLKHKGNGENSTNNAGKRQFTLKGGHHSRPPNRRATKY